MKRPAECTSLADVRTEIDRLDAELLRTLAERRQYVLAAARFKSSPAAVADPARVQAMIAVRRGWAAEQGLNPDMVESLFRLLVEHFIAEEQAHFQSTRTMG
jgi:isochorismate pyruvate lyase